MAGEDKPVRDLTPAAILIAILSVDRLVMNVRYSASLDHGHHCFFVCHGPPVIPRCSPCHNGVEDCAFPQLSI